MPHNFEHDVQQSLSGLQLEPGAPVWPAIAARIQQKQKRRRLLFWLLPLGIALVSGAGYYFAQQSEQKNTATAVGDAVQLQKNNSLNNAAISTPQQKRLPTTDIDDNKSTDTTQTLTKSSSGEGAPMPYRAKNNNSIAAAANTKTLVAESAILIEKYRNFNVTKEVKKGTVDRSISRTSITEPPRISYETTAIKNISTDDNLITQKAKAAEINTDTASIISSALKQKTKGGKLQWILHLAAGYNSYGKALFSNAPSQDFFYASPLQGIGSLPQNNSRSQVVYGPGRWVSIGTTVQKKWTKNLWAFAGLQYSLATITVKSSKANDTAVVYRNNTASADAIKSAADGLYNQYHFIEIPVGVSYAVLKNKKLIVSHSLHPSLLVSSRHVVFAGANTTSTANKKFQLFATTGVQYSVLTKQKFTLGLGPQVRYQLTPLQQSNNRRMLQAGIQTTIKLLHP